MSIGETLKLDIEEHAQHFRGNSRLFQLARRGMLTPKAIATYLAGLLYLMQHTEQIMQLARSRSAELGRERLADFFENKAREEKGHDRWAETDASTLGAMFGVAMPDLPPPSVVSLLDYLRSMIVEEPAQLLAYIVFAEYFTVIMGPEWLRLLEEQCGIPISAMTVVDRHVEADRLHAAAAIRELDALIDGQDVERLRVALRTSIGYFDGFCDEISAVAA